MRVEILPRNDCRKKARLQLLVEAVELKVDEVAKTDQEFGVRQEVFHLKGARENEPKQLELLHISGVTKTDPVFANAKNGAKTVNIHHWIVFRVECKHRVQKGHAQCNARGHVSQNGKRGRFVQQVLVAFGAEMAKLLQRVHAEKSIDETPLRVKRFDGVTEHGIVFLQKGAKSDRFRVHANDAAFALLLFIRFFFATFTIPVMI